MTLTDEYKIKLKKNGQIKTISINTDPQAGKVAENDKNKNSAAEREAQNRAFNEGFYGTDSHGYEVLKPVSINQGSGRMRKQNNISQGDPFLEGLWGEDAPTQQDTYYSSTRNAEKQYREPDPDFEKAFLEGFMGEDYTKEMQAGIKNIALPKQENYSNTANNKHNSAAGDIGKKTVRSEGLHYLPNGGTDSYGRQLPAGSYIRVQNGTEYVVLPNDPRIKERIAAEYAAQEAAKQDKPPISPEQKEIPEILQIGAEKPAAEPNPEADENWENAFSGSDSEEKIELPNNIFGEDEIDTSDYDSFIDYVEENGLYYDFYAGYNEQGEKVRFAELYDSETGERLVTLQEGRDFFYAEDGVFTKELIEIY